LGKEKIKTEKYSRLMAVTAKQFTQRKRRQAPTFAPFALADNGELGTAATHTQEWIVEHYRRMHKRSPPRLDGQTIPTLVRVFRHDLKRNVMLALAAGFGAALNAAGQAWHITKLYAKACMCVGVCVCVCERAFVFFSLSIA
jgi:hypothetical protein